MKNTSKIGITQWLLLLTNNSSRKWSNRRRGLPTSVTPEMVQSHCSPKRSSTEPSSWMINIWPFLIKTTWSSVRNSWDSHKIAQTFNRRSVTTGTTSSIPKWAQMDKRAASSLRSKRRPTRNSTKLVSQIRFTIWWTWLQDVIWPEPFCLPIEAFKTFCLSTSNPSSVVSGFPYTISWQSVFLPLTTCKSMKSTKQIKWDRCALNLFVSLVELFRLPRSLQT